MHQEHNIPWNILASNVQFVRENRCFTPRQTGYFARNLPTQGKALTHFAKSIESAIPMFAKTERAKYPESIPPPLSGKIFSDELRDQYPEFLNEKNQLIKYWIFRARKVDTWSNPGGESKVFYAYDSFDGDLCEAVCTLFHAKALPSLLMLAQHPKIPLQGLRLIPHGYQPGFEGVVIFALRPYIFFNLAAAAGTLRTGEYLKMMTYMSGFSPASLFPSQTLPHREFFGNPWAGTWVGQLDPARLPIPHHDLPGLREYLNTLFSLLYSYDVVMRECGQDPQWEKEVVCAIRSTVIRVKTEYVKIDDGPGFTPRFVC
jgi:hypothetical protein